MKLSIIEERGWRGETNYFGGIIEQLGAESTWRIAQNAMAKAAQPMLAEMRRRMPVRTGMTRATLAIRKSSKQPSVLVGVFAPRSHIGRFLQDGYLRRSRVAGGGVVHIPAKPWMPEGFDGGIADEVMRNVSEGVMKALAR